MKWMGISHKCIIVLVIICLLGTIAQACEEYEEEKCYEEEKEETIIEEKVESPTEPEFSFSESKWFIILANLIERYPIIERIIERIFQWIFNNLLGIDY
ncbi:MAG: hypothetical protein AYK22_05900 [Thermoplasmatales archaeon SG8-52-3]|nr:MAG: hypothetical protein AYK22_05900 [Thermoplasmatales archaeon SG8-52-3]